MKTLIHVVLQEVEICLRLVVSISTFCLLKVALADGFSWTHESFIPLLLAVWYALEGTGGAINVDLQSTVKTVQLSIFSGDCNSLDCVAGRLGEGTFINKATETFDSTDGTLYYLYAQVEAGDFSLTTTEVTRPDNDDCISATELSLGSAVSGSTLYASSDNVRDLCGRTNPISAPGTWFSLQGTGDTMTATFEASYDAQLTVFAGIDCETLTCIDGTDGEPPDYQAGSVRWASASGVTYFLFMHGFNDQVGPFNLTVSGADDDAALPESVEADVCTDAIRIEPDGEVVRGSTAFAAPDEGLDYCGSISSEASTGGLWYVFSGTGTVLQVSVGASFDSQISLFAGECDSLTCIDGNNESQVSTASSLILFESSVDQTYYVLVHGVAPSRGEFALSVSEVTIPENDSCEESAILEVGDLVTGSTFAATSADDFAFAQCGTTLGGDSSAPGIFYSVVGTGQLLSVAISANYDMQLTIFEGDDCTNLVCVDGTEGDTANLSAGSITFDSQDGVRYILFVHGFEGRVGEYELSIDSVNRPPNDLCTGAIAIPADLPIGG